jgi:hypothetical protein
MCDYSLHAVATRSARIGETLISTRFANTATHGFAGVDEPGVAVCLLPGTEVVFDKEVEYSRGWFFFRRPQPAGRLARFRQINQKSPDAHHDALEFSNGQVVLVHSLHEGQRATILQMPATPRAVNDEGIFQLKPADEKLEERHGHGAQSVSPGRIVRSV